MKDELDMPCTPEDREAVQLSAMVRSLKLKLLADRVLEVGRIIRTERPIAAKICFDAVTELRQLAGGAVE